MLSLFPCSVCSAGACDVVTRSMTAFPDNIDVQLVACVAVGNLANRYPANKNRLGAAGACNKVKYLENRVYTLNHAGAAS